MCAVYTYVPQCRSCDDDARVIEDALHFLDVTQILDKEVNVSTFVCLVEGELQQAFID